MQRHSPQKRASVGASPTEGTNLEPQALIVMQRAFNPLNGEPYPGGSPTLMGYKHSKLMRLSCTPQNWERYPGHSTISFP